MQYMLNKKKKNINIKYFIIPEKDCSYKYYKGSLNRNRGNSICAAGMVFLGTTNFSSNLYSQSDVMLKIICIKFNHNFLPIWNTQPSKCWEVERSASFPPKQDVKLLLVVIQLPTT